MSDHDHSSDLVALSKLNGDFRRNYGKVLGAFLYLRSIAAVRPRTYLVSGLLVALATVCLALWEKKLIFWLQAK
ncbi:hypothetical protein LMTR3_25150 [Bradyrhizobium sp. LMTR 3]|nr:hypothetical protein LMTR3_25150 [Bradyrhizobium sp. LMTR 3]